MIPGKIDKLSGRKAHPTEDTLAQIQWRYEFIELLLFFNESFKENEIKKRKLRCNVCSSIPGLPQTGFIRFKESFEKVLKRF